MNENCKFSDIPYTSPDVEALQTRYDALTHRARAAACPEDLLDVVRQRDALQTGGGGRGAGARVHLHPLARPRHPAHGGDRELRRA